MSVAIPPEPPVSDARVAESTPEVRVTSATAEAQAPPPTREPPAPPAAPYVPPTAQPPPARPRGVAGGLILIAIGIIALFGTWFPGRGAWLFLGLGTAFLVGRVMTGRPGYAVPAGILLGFGSFIWFTETGMLSGPAAGGTFFIFLGLGFLASYAIAARPAAAWPLFPGLVLIGFGVFVQATTMGAPLGQFWWLAQYWPSALVAVGAWLLVRDRLPETAQTPVAVVGASALVLIGLLVAAAGVTSVTSGYVGVPMPMFRGWPGIGVSTLQDTITLTAPGTGVDSVRLVNTSGYTLVRATDATEVRVQATRHFWTSGNAPEVRLVPANGILTVETAPVFVGPGNNSAFVDFTIDVPARFGADIRSASGAIEVRGLGGPVHLESASGSVEARDLAGALSAVTASGAIQVSSIDGEVQLRSASGSISANDVDRLRQAQSISGAISLGGGFTSAAQISSISGEVVMRFAPGAAVNIDASSFSGDVSGNVPLNSRIAGPHNLAGTLGDGGPTVSIRTTSGSIRLTRGS